MCKKIINTKKSISSVLQFGNASMISEAYRRIYNFGADMFIHTIQIVNNKKNQKYSGACANIGAHFFLIKKLLIFHKI